MARWQSDPELQRLVRERSAGHLSRRQFLARLGGTAVGAAAVSTMGAPPAWAQKKIVVTMWDTEPNPATRAAVKAIVEDFQKLHKDIEIRAEGMGWGDMDRKLQAAMAAKSPPTASHTQTYVVTSFRAKGLIEPVDDLVKAIGEDRIFPSVLRWLKYPDGKYWGLTHAWGADNLGGRGDYLAGTGVDPRSWKTWDDWLRDLPKLNRAPQYYGVSLAGIPFFVNEDVYMWTGSNGGSLFDDKGNPALESPQVLGMLEFWKKVKPYLPAGWASHDYLETLSAWATGKTTQVYTWGAPPDTSTSTPRPTSATRSIFQMWPKTIGPMGKAPLNPVRQRTLGALRGCPEGGEGGRQGVPQVLLQERELPPLLRFGLPAAPALEFFKEDFQDPSYMGHPERKRSSPLCAIAFVRKAREVLGSETARVHIAARRRGRDVAARGAGAAARRGAAHRCACEPPLRTIREAQARNAAFLQSLQQLDWTVGRNVTIDSPLGCGQRRQRAQICGGIARA